MLVQVKPERQLTYVGFSDMGWPRFRVGDRVQVQAVSVLSTAEAFMDPVAREIAYGVYEVTAVLPDVFGHSRYWIRQDDYERVVREAQLDPVEWVPQPRR